MCIAELKKHCLKIFIRTLGCVSISTSASLPLNQYIMYKSLGTSKDIINIIFFMLFRVYYLNKSVKQESY